MYTIVVCVLNEQENIVDLIKDLKSNNPSEIIIIDGGSVDNTKILISNYPEIKLLTLDGKGLLAQRLLGIKESKTECIVLINADDRFADGAIDFLYQEFIEKNCDGMQMRMAAFSPQKYCEKAWNVYFNLLGSPGDSLPLLGRPCITKKKYFDNIYELKKIFNEDTYLMQEQKKLYGDLRYIVSKAKCNRKCLPSWFDNLKQFSKYGISDADVAVKYGNYFQLIYHHLGRIAIYRAFKSIIMGEVKYAPFIFLMGIVRFYFFFTTIIQRVVNPKKL